MLSGKTAVITGASRGIGREIAALFSKNGANIAVIFGGSEQAAREACMEAEALGVSAKMFGCDVADHEAVKAVCSSITAEFGVVDILVNNAGITRDGLVMKMSENDFDAVIDTNLKGAFNFIKYLSRQLIRSPAGRIINISSVSGLVGNSGQANYSAAKAGLIGLTKTVARELAGRGVTCNAIAPGYIETDMTRALGEEVLSASLERIPLRRVGTPDDVAELALFLASGRASYITGEVIRVDGGMCI